MALPGLSEAESQRLRELQLEYNLRRSRIIQCYNALMNIKLIDKEKNMPCMCWYDPPEESKKIIKDACQTIVNEVKLLQIRGDPIGYELKDVKKLIDHLYNPKMCDDSKN